MPRLVTPFLLASIFFEVSPHGGMRIYGRKSTIFAEAVAGTLVVQSEMARFHFFWRPLHWGTEKASVTRPTKNQNERFHSASRIWGGFTCLRIAKYIHSYNAEDSQNQSWEALNTVA